MSCTVLPQPMAKKPKILKVYKTEVQMDSSISSDKYQGSLEISQVAKNLETHEECLKLDSNLQPWLYEHDCHNCTTKKNDKYENSPTGVFTFTRNNIIAKNMSDTLDENAKHLEEKFELKFKNMQEINDLNFKNMQEINDLNFKNMQKEINDLNVRAAETDKLKIRVEKLENETHFPIYIREMRKQTRLSIFKKLDYEVIEKSDENYKVNCKEVEKIIKNGSKKDKSRMVRITGWEIRELKMLFMYNNIDKILNKAAHPIMSENESKNELENAINYFFSKNLFNKNNKKLIDKMLNEIYP
jgi:hypothetical protein